MKVLRQRLNDWENNAGGMLQVYSNVVFGENFVEMCEDADIELNEEADFKIKLYTALSAHKPNEGGQLIYGQDAARLKKDPDNEPNWGLLVKIMHAKFPDKHSAWSVRAVTESVKFLELKRDHNDWDSDLFYPSMEIDQVCHEHLSFIDRYHYDVRAFCGGNLIEHSPVLGEEEFKRYETAYRMHVSRMKRLTQSSGPTHAICNTTRKTTMVTRTVIYPCLKMVVD
jgi:hypothetical protein